MGHHVLCTRAGFGAAKHLASQGYSVTLLDGSPNPGGLSTGWRTEQGRAVEAGVKGFWYQVLIRDLRLSLLCALQSGSTPVQSASALTYTFAVMYLKPAAEVVMQSRVKRALHISDPFEMPFLLMDLLIRCDTWAAVSQHFCLGPGAWDTLALHRLDHQRVLESQRADNRGARLLTPATVPHPAGPVCPYLSVVQVAPSSGPLLRDPHCQLKS